MKDKYVSVFKRCETDIEFRARLSAKGYFKIDVPRQVKHAYLYGTYETTEVESRWLNDLTGKELDDAAWYSCKMQRRIIEDAK